MILTFSKSQDYNMDLLPTKIFPAGLSTPIDLRMVAPSFVTWMLS